MDLLTPEQLFSCGRCKGLWVNPQRRGSISEECHQSCPPPPFPLLSYGLLACPELAQHLGMPNSSPAGPALLPLGALLWHWISVSSKPLPPMLDTSYGTFVTSGLVVCLYSLH